MEQSTLANGMARDFARARGFRSGQTDLSTRASGRMIWLTAKADSSIKMEMCMRDNGSMIKLMVKVFINI